MIYPELEIIVDNRLFMANVIEVTPRYRRVAMLVRTLALVEPPEVIVVRILVMQLWGNHEGAPGIVGATDGLSPTNETH